MAPTRPQKLTQTDKLRAMNNLQSEITRRARSLRAEYARVAQSLRSKLEMRVYRIPKALRSANMGELLQKYIDMQEHGEAKVERTKESSRAAPKRSPAVARKTQTATAAAKAKAQATNTIDHSASTLKPARTAQTARTRGIKRTSDIMIAADNNGTDKENEESVENPKKRAKDDKQRTASRPLRDPAAVLSPKSNNSRNLPQSPAKPTFGLPSKGYASRPASPLKAPTVSRIPPASPVRQAATRPTAASTAGTTRATATRTTKAATTASTRAGTATGTRATAARAGARSASNSTNDSTGTTGTTIVRRGAVSRAGGTTAAAAAAKKTTGATGSTAASARRTAATRVKADPKAEAPAPTRRVLRKRA